MDETADARGGAPEVPRGVLTDFGGVLTTSVLASFRAFSARVSGAPLLLERLFREDREAGELLVEHECGRMTAAEFDRRLADRLRAKGVTVESSGLIDAVASGMRPDTTMLRALRELRARGVPVAIVSNTLGDNCYQGYDLHDLADVVVLSSETGSRKPGRRIYRTACERLGLPPSACLMIDDLEQNLRGAARLGIRGLHHVRTEETTRALGEMFGIDALGGGARGTR
ncbi:HAD family hydrolase [Streptomyces sp. WMMC1477]|uniref:HAD family hydrolase n=1 Tax=Streptomyces sp. WMMC1477 TaxID=3015155 RepID=UPI0022B63D7F|nr:HAD family phosphatase [Streptomyces sp. WMMC1477]MCZ7434730.1 HAD family phosphatase [Streptomyces sp. WMMC1477]